MRPSILSPRAASAVLVCALLCWAAPALGDNVEEAKRAFDAAETAYKLGKYKEAIKEYEAAFRAMAEPAFLYNMAQAHRQQYNLDKKSFHLHKALNLYKTYLRESKETQRKQVVKNLIDELKQIISALEANAPADNTKKPGRLILRGELAKGGVITLDGKRWGTVPWSGEVKPGTHVVKVTKDGFNPWSTTVKVSGGGEVEVAVMLTGGGAAGRGGEVGETPIYKKWWLWTIVGVAVVGAGVGVGLGLHFSNSGGENNVSSLPTIDLR